MQIINPVTSGAGAGPLMKTGNKWTVFNGVSLMNNSATTVANFIRAFKVYIPNACTLTPNVLVSTGVASGHVTAAFYNADATTGLPGTKAYDFGQFDISTTGTKTNAGVAVAAGEYWCVFAIDQAQNGNIYFATITTTPDNMLVNNNGYFTGLDGSGSYAFPMASPASYTFSQRVAAVLCPVFFNVS